jgi:hypothetical protein
MRFQAARAHAAFDEAFALLPEADRKAQKPGLMMANIYRTLLREIEAGRLPGAAPAHLADPAAQAVDRRADPVAWTAERALTSTPALARCRAAWRWSARAGLAWPRPWRDLQPGPHAW